MRPSGRKLVELRPISIETGVMAHAEGSCLIRMGNTHVLCSASIEEKPPAFLRGTGQGWVTAEYGMLPRATHSRNRREAAAQHREGRFAVAIAALVVDRDGDARRHALEPRQILLVTRHYQLDH